MPHTTISDPGPAASSTTSLAERFRRAARIASVAVTALGPSVLVGWKCDSAFLMGVNPAFNSMKPNTAVLFVVLGIGLVVLPLSRFARIRRVCAAFLILASAALLLEHVLGRDLRIDGVVSEALGFPAAGSRRIAAVTAVNFLLLGVALVLNGSRRRFALSEALVVVVSANSFIALCGYIYRADAMYRSGATSIALNSVIGFLVACVAWFAARPDQGFASILTSSTSAGKMMRRLGPWLIISPVLIGKVRVLGQDLGYYDTLFGVAILIGSSVVLLTVVASRIVSTLHTRELSQRADQFALRLSEAKYRDLYENSPDMCATIDLRNEVVVDCNLALTTMLGYSKEEMVGKSVRDLYPPEHQPPSNSAEVVQSTGQIRNAERILHRRNGTPLEVSLNVTGVKDAEGRTIGGRAVWRDISDAKQAERDQLFLLRLSELQRTSTDPLELLFLVSEQLCNYLQVSRCAFIEIDSAQDLATTHRHYHGNLAPLPRSMSLSQYSLETLIEQQAGRITLIEDARTDPRTSAMFDASYGPLGLHSSVTVPLLREGVWTSSLSLSHTQARAWQPRELSLAQVVAERTWLWVEHLRMANTLREKVAEDAVRQIEKRFQMIVASVRDYAIITLDLSGRITTWNAAAERIKGYSAAEAIGSHFSLLYGPADQARNAPAGDLARAQLDGQYEDEGWRPRKDGTTFWASRVITALRDDDGTCRGFSQVTRDFSERRRISEELALEHEKLTSALQEREVLLQEVHHRVKNNLQVISSLISMQARKLRDEGAKRALDECRARVEAIALIHQQLYQSQDYARIPFAEYARTLASSIFRTAGVSPENVRFEVEIEDVSLAVDRAIPCGLILNELITNSLKHAFPNGRQGVLRVELKPGASGQLFLAVVDDGVGVPEGGAVSKSGSLGMSLISTLVRQLGGKLEVLTGNGTAFHVRFPQDSKPAPRGGLLLASASPPMSV